MKSKTIVWIVYSLIVICIVIYAIFPITTGFEKTEPVPIQMNPPTLIVVAIIVIIGYLYMHKEVKEENKEEIK